MAHTPHDEGSMFGSAHGMGYPASFGYASRQAAAPKGACDMDSLKMAISLAIPGTGQVQQAITDAIFVPRAPAFTSLIQTCAKYRQVEKAFEVFDTMANSERIGIKPNTVHYSALISACATAGKWQEALEVFHSMKQAATTDPDCKPNTITYSSLISACAAGSRLDKALQVYDEMQEAGLQPDHITFSTLISAYEKAGDFAEALALLDKLHEAGGAASPDTYVKIMQYLAGKQLWNRALEVFLELQLAGVALSQPLCLALLSVFEACGQSQQAQDVLTAARNASLPLTTDLYNAVLRCCILEQHGERAVEVWEEMQATGVPFNVASAEALLQASRSCTHLTDKVAQLIAPFQPALAAAQLTQTPPPHEPRLSDPAAAVAAQALLRNRAPTALSGPPVPMPSALTSEGGPGWQAESNTALEGTHHDQASGVGLLVAEPSTDMLPAAPASGLDQSFESGTAPEKETLDTAPGSGPPTAAPVTPVARSETAELSSSCSL